MEGGTPKRLVLDEGQWALEVEKLLALDGSHFRPTLYSVDGAELLIQWLERSPQMFGLAQQAQQIVNRPVADKAAQMAFEVRGESWSPAPFRPAIHSASGVGADGTAGTAASAAELETLKQRLLVLEHQFQRIAQIEVRVTRLEKLMRTMHASQTVPPLATMQQGALEAVAPSAAAVEPEPQATSSQEAQAEPVPAVAEPAAEAEPAAPEEDKLLRTPHVPALQKHLRMLVGDELTLEEERGETHPDLAEFSPLYYFSNILNDNDETVGAMLCDLESTCHMGGNLMMTPESAITEQITQAEPSEETIDAISEVFNNLGSTLNNIKGNFHVRASPAELLDLDEHTWFDTASRRRDFLVNMGGRLIFLVK